MRKASAALLKRASATRLPNETRTATTPAPPISARSENPPDATFNTITCQRIVLPDASGRPVITLEVKPNGNARIEMMCANSTGIGLFVEDGSEVDGEPYAMLTLEYQGNAVVVMSNRTNGNPHITMDVPQGQGHQRLTLEPDEVMLTHTTGKPAARLFTEPPDVGNAESQVNLELFATGEHTMSLDPTALIVNRAETTAHVFLGFEGGPRLNIG